MQVLYLVRKLDLLIGVGNRLDEEGIELLPVVHVELSWVPEFAA